MSLYSEKRIYSYEWAQLPIDDDVADRVEELADLEEAPEIKRGYPIFKWKQNVLEVLGLHAENEDMDLLNVHGGKENIVQHEKNDIIIDDAEDQGLVDFAEQVDINYVSEEDSSNNDTTSKGQKKNGATNDT